MTGRKRWLFGGGIALTVLILDQFTKWWMLEKVGLTVGRAIEVTPFFNLVMVRNYGVSFGMLANDHELGRWLLILMALVITGIMLWLMARSTHRLALTAQSLVVGGAIGNVIDRLNHGAVIDFLDFYIGIWHWPAFNVADAAIVCGVALLLIDGIVHPHPNKE